MGKEDGFIYVLGGLTVALLLFSFVACTQGIISSNKIRKQLITDKCQLVSKTKTGERLYCGKACTTPEHAYTHVCKPDDTAEYTWIIKGR